MPPSDMKSMGWGLALVVLISLGVTMYRLMAQSHELQTIQRSMGQRESDAFLQGNFASTHYFICRRDEQNWPKSFDLSAFDELRKEGFTFVHPEVDCEEIRRKDRRAAETETITTHAWPSPTGVVAMRYAMKLIPFVILLTVNLTLATSTWAGECVSYPTHKGIRGACAETAEDAWRMSQRPPPERHVFQDALCCSPVGSTERCRPYTWPQLNELRWYQTYTCRGMNHSEIINDISCRERMRTAIRNIQLNPAWLHEHAAEIDTLVLECD